MYGNIWIAILANRSGPVQGGARPVPIAGTHLTQTLKEPALHKPVLAAATVITVLSLVGCASSESGGADDAAVAKAPMTALLPAAAAVKKALGAGTTVVGPTVVAANFGVATKDGLSRACDTAQNNLNQVHFQAGEAEEATFASGTQLVAAADRFTSDAKAAKGYEAVSAWGKCQNAWRSGISNGISFTQTGDVTVDGQAYNVQNGFVFVLNGEVIEATTARIAVPDSTIPYVHPAQLAKVVQLQQTTLDAVK